MNITILTNEYPPHIYGGAGVHVEYLSRQLAAPGNGGHTVSVLCFGDQRISGTSLNVEGIQVNMELPCRNARHTSLIDALFRNIAMAECIGPTEILHCHTWYTYLAGCLAKQFLDVPLVLTVHSLEPQRPWKEEQLGSGYRASSWLEKTAFENADGIIAVSEFMRSAVQDLYRVPSGIVRTIPNGIDVSEYSPAENPVLLKSYGIDVETPFILFVGRISRQKGIFFLLEALRFMKRGMQVVFVAAGADTKELEGEMAEKIRGIKAATSHKIVWINRFVPREDVIPIYTHASVFVCPSIYEPFGLINLEAMACGTPVIASAVGGIVDIIVDGETGLLIPFEPVGQDDPQPREPEVFARNLAEAIESLLAAPGKIADMGTKCRERVIANYSWRAVAEQTIDFYGELVKKESRQ